MHIFLTKVERDPSGCWLWTAGKNKKGYGQFRVPGLTGRAHRYAFWLVHDYLPDADRDVAHSCHTSSCVNPFHLVDQSKSGNLADQRRQRRAGLAEGQCARCLGTNTYFSTKRNYLKCRDCNLRNVQAFYARYRGEHGRPYKR